MNPDPFQTRRDYAQVHVRLGSDAPERESPRFAYITQDDGSGNPVAVYRGAFIDGFECKFDPDNDDEEPFLVFMDRLPGVWLTGQLISIEKVKHRGETTAKWRVADSGADQWSIPSASATINPTGNLNLGYWRDDTAAYATCSVAVELFNTSSPVNSGQACWVMLREDFESVENPDAGTLLTKFIVIPRDCPDYQAEV